MKKISRSKILFGNLFFAFSSMTFATPATDQSINLFFNNLNLTEMFEVYQNKNTAAYDREADQIIKQYAGHSALTTDEHLLSIKLSLLLQNFSKDFIRSPEIKTELKKIYKEKFTEEEMQAYIKFLAPPEGRSIFYKSIEISGDLSEMGSNIMHKVMQTPEFEKKYSKQVTEIMQQLHELSHEN